MIGLYVGFIGQKWVVFGLNRIVGLFGPGCGRVEDLGLHIFLFSVFMIILAKLNFFIDLCGVNYLFCDGLMDVVKLSSVGLIFLFCFSFEGSVRVDVRLIVDFGMIGEVLCSEDVVVFAFVHLNNNCELI